MSGPTPRRVSAQQTESLRHGGQAHGNFLTVVAQSRQLVITASYRIATAREPVLQASANRHAGWHVLRDVTWLGRWHRQVIH
jgi:hypothetical protein